jgi:ABC-2 type transport system permease protein
VTQTAESVAVVRTVARRELVERFRDKSFAISTVLTILILVAIIVIPRLVGSGRPTYQVGTVGSSAAALGRLVEQGAGPAGFTVRLSAVPDRAAAEQAVLSGRLTAVLLDNQVLVKTSLPDRLSALLAGTSQAAGAAQRLIEAGVPPQTVREALSTPPVAVHALRPQSRAHQENRGIAFAGILLLYGQLVTYGIWVASGVVEEKSSRVVEVLLAAIRPRQLLSGKVIGIGLLGLFQLVLIGIAGIVAAISVGALHLHASAWLVLGQVLVWFLLGYAFYATAFAGSAATVSRQEDLQNAITPLNLLIIGSFFLAFTALNNSTSTLARVASLIPVRWAGGEVAGWELALSFGLMLVALVLLIRVASRLYERSVLLIGAKVRIRDILRMPR